MLRVGIIGIIYGLSLCSAAAGAENITSDTYFYGQSPPVYPCRMSTVCYYYVPPIDNQLELITNSGGQGVRILGCRL